MKKKTNFVNRKIIYLRFAIWQNLDKQRPQQRPQHPPAKAFSEYPMRTNLLEHSRVSWVESRFWTYSAPGHKSIHFIIPLVSAHSRLIIQNSQWCTAVFIIKIIHIALVALALVRHYHYNIIFVFLLRPPPLLLFKLEQTMGIEANGDDSNVSFHNSLCAV